MGLQLDGEVGVVRVVLEIIFFKHGVVEASGKAASLYMLDLTTGEVKEIYI